MSLLAVDIGSSSLKAMVFTPQGEVVRTCSAAYLPEFKRPGFAEIDPNQFWDGLCTCCQVVGQNLAHPISALCLSSHGETFIPVNSEGEPVGSAILNQDGRAAVESKKLEEIIGRRKIFEITGLIVHPMYPIPKILWIRKHEPEIFAQSKSFLTVIGYLLLRMGLPPFVDYSLASRYLAFDIQSRSWSKEILAAVELDCELLPTPVPAGTIVGKLTSSVARQLGLRAGTPVVLGGHDQPCGALGVGVVDEGRVADSIGTYECILATSKQPAINDKAFAASLNSYCHVAPERFVTIAYFPSGIMMKWFHDLLYPSDHGQDSEFEGAHYAALEKQAPQGPTGLCITPHLIGTCNPEFNSNVRGWIGGLSPMTGRAEIYKGILEGLACELTILTEMMREATGSFRDIYVSGGGSRSKLGLQLRAALTGCSLHMTKQPEAVCVGGAILAGVAIGEYKDIPEAIAQLVKEEQVIASDAELAENYQEQITRYRKFRALTLQQA